MPEEIKKKINLSGLNISGQEKKESEKKDSSHLSSPLEETDNTDVLPISPKEETEGDQKVEKEKIEIKSSKISLAGMKQKRDTPKSSSVQKNEQNLDEEENNEKIKTVVKKSESSHEILSLENEKTNITLDVDTKKEDGETPIDSKKNNSSTNEEKSSTDILPKTEEDTPLFSNYTSDFEKDQGSIIEKLKNLGKKPKTRIFLVLGLIISTVLIIAVLFIVNPEKHSISNYKSVLSNMYDKYTGKNINIEKNSNAQIQETKKQEWKKDSLIRTGYKINIETKINKLGVKIYKFNNTEFKTLTELNAQIDKEIEKLKSGKVKDFLLKNKLKKQKKISEQESNTSSDTTSNIQTTSSLDLLKNR